MAEGHAQSIALKIKEKNMINTMRKYLLLMIMVIGLGGFGVTPSHANDLNYIDANSVGRVLQSLGLSYQTKFDENNVPRIVVTDKNMRSEQFEIYFFDCKMMTKCESITLWSWYLPTVSIQHARLNRWNQRNRFTKSYLDKNFKPTLELDIHASGGLGNRNLALLMNFYIENMKLFADYMVVK